MNKKAIFILGLMVLFFGTAYATTKMGAKVDNNVVADNIVIKEEEETPTQEQVPVVSTASEDIKVIPSTLLILKNKYTDCGHTIISNAEIPEEMVNMTEEELKKAYSSWNVEKFTKEEVILSRETDSFCGEHYLVIAEEGKVMIYTLDEQGGRLVKEETEIAFEYLPETDKIILNNGIYVYGTEELNKIKEDYE